MAAYKFTAQRGKLHGKDVAVAAGSAEAQSDTISVNIDVTNLRKADVLHILTGIFNKIQSGPWPPLA